MTKFQVFKVGGIGWVATCACLGACSALDEFKTWQEAFDYALKAAQGEM